MGKPKTAQQRVAALMDDSDCGTRNLYAAIPGIQSANPFRKTASSFFLPKVTGFLEQKRLWVEPYEKFDFHFSCFNLQHDDSSGNSH
jgi:hypothetical protein